jgi:hypothetical protein
VSAYWTRGKIARLSDDALQALLDDGDLTDYEINVIEDEQDVREYDDSDPASPQNLAEDARDSSVDVGSDVDSEYSAPWRG